MSAPHYIRILVTTAVLCGCTQPIPEAATAPPPTRLIAKPMGSLESGSVYIVTDSDTGCEYMVIYGYSTGVAIQPLIKKP